MPLLMDKSPGFTWFVTLLLLIALLLLGAVPLIHQWLYHGMRLVYSTGQNQALALFHQDSTAHFTYAYETISQESLAIIQTESEKIFAGVNDFFDFTPHGKIPVVIYDSSEALNNSFGWDGDRSPMGVYWMGYIKILAPEAWIDGDASARRQIFQRMGPMAHEYSHYVVDWQTNGNYPRWFSEGIAQYVEQSLSYFTTEPPLQARQPLYPFAVLEKSFDTQADQPLAYWQSLQAVHYLVDHYGESIIGQLLARLRRGQSFSRALYELTGLRYADLDALLATTIPLPSFTH